MGPGCRTQEAGLGIWTNTGRGMAGLGVAFSTVSPWPQELPRGFPNLGKGATPLLSLSSVLPGKTMRPCARCMRDSSRSWRTCTATSWRLGITSVSGPAGRAQWQWRQGRQGQQGRQGWQLAAEVAAGSRSGRGSSQQEKWSYSHQPWHISSGIPGVPGTAKAWNPVQPEAIPPLGATPLEPLELYLGAV